MDKEFLKKAISEQLGAINEQFETIRRHEKKIPQIELDIMLSNMREMYEYLYALDKLNQPASQPLPPPKPEVKSAETEPAEKKEATVETALKPPAPDQETKPEKPAPEEKKAPAATTKKDTPPQPAPESRPVESDVTPPQKEPEKKPVAVDTIPGPMKTTKTELADGSSATLADKLKRGDEVRIADKVGQKVDSLKRAIGINEKFLFINELFNGKLTDYNNAIKMLDDMPDADSCISEFKKLSDEYKWDKESDTYRKLEDFIHKKHGVEG